MSRTIKKIRHGHRCPLSKPVRPGIHCSCGRKSLATFYARLIDAFSDLGIDVTIHDRPNEIPDPIPFAEDEVHVSYEAEYAENLWKAMLQIDSVLKKFRTGFLGKSSPVHFYRGSFDLAVTRFSGRPAPLHPGGIPNLPDRPRRSSARKPVNSSCHTTSFARPMIRTPRCLSF